MEREEVNISQKVSVNRVMISFLDSALEHTPIQDKSTVNGLPSPNRVLECLVEIAASGTISNEDQQVSYRLATRAYEKYDQMLSDYLHQISTL